MAHRIPILVGAGVALVLALGALLVHRAGSDVNDVAMAAAPKPVTVVAAQDARYRDQRLYVGTLRPWIEAHVGPQYIAVYVDTVLVRPGAVVKRGEVLATLDCRNASAASQAVAAEARAMGEQQRAVAEESRRMESLLDGGFIDPNSVQLKQAQSSSQLAQLAAQRAKLTATNLEVNDCILRAPFDGEIATRTIDPGAFVRPGTSIVTVVDRSTVRMTFDAPEGDFEAVAPNAPVSIHIVATDRTVSGLVSRRSPSADPDTRTVHVEVDLADANREVPVNTTAEARIDVGAAVKATAVPLDAASISGLKASVFVVEDGIARRVSYKMLGEREATLYVEPALAPGVQIVTEGRAVLSDGDRVAAKQVPFTASSSASAPASPQGSGK